MTYREKLQKEHPGCINEYSLGGCDGCPYEYEYEKKKEEICKVSDEECRKCWDRVIPGTEEMTKDDLKDGMVCEQRDGELNIWLNGMLRQTHTCRSGTGMDLRDEDGCKKFDIIKVYKTDGRTLSEMLDRENLTLIWERKETKEMTIAEIEQALGHPVKIIGDSHESDQ